jgi:hypothetical protein
MNEICTEYGFEVKRSSFRGPRFLEVGARACRWALLCGVEVFTSRVLLCRFSRGEAPKGAGALG